MHSAPVPQLVDKLKALPQISDVSSDWQDKGLAAYVNVNRDTASRLGITMSDVDNALYNAFGQRLISTIYTQANQYRVVLEHNTENTPGLAALDSIRLTSKDGGIVPLSAIASVEERHTPLSINHLDQFPSTTISFNVPDGYSWAKRWRPFWVRRKNSASRPIFRPSSVAVLWRSVPRWAAPSG